jgi:hypothetical protein
VHEFERGVTKYDIMPIPPVEAQSQRFEIGPVSIWVEYRLLDDAIAAAHTVTESYEGEITAIEDRGVSLHVFGEPEPGQAEIEFLRFDCFDEDPHYHYVSYACQTNEMVHLDPVAHGDPLEWALDRIRTRLPQMLERAGAANLASRVEWSLVEQVLPKVTEAAYRARFEHDDETIRAGSLATAAPVGKAASSAESAP